MKTAPLLITAILIISPGLKLLAQNKVKALQYERCQDLPVIDLDSIYDNINESNKVTYILFRGESTHANGDKTITPLGSYIVDFDTSLATVISYELKYTAGANNCLFSYKTSKGNISQSKGVPPVLFITCNNKELFHFLKSRFQLKEFSPNPKYLIVPGITENDSAFYSKLNNIISGYHSFYYESKYIQKLHYAVKPPKPESILAGFNAGYGLLRLQYKQIPSLTQPARQSFSAHPEAYHLSFWGKYFLTPAVFVKGALELNYYKAAVFSDGINQYPTSRTYFGNQSYTVLKQDPMTYSTTLLGSLTVYGGYQVLIPSHKRAIPFNIDLGISIGKMTGMSHAAFMVQKADKTIVPIHLYGPFKDRFTVYFISNPTIELPISGKTKLNLGLTGLIGFSKMKSDYNYRLLTDAGKFTALESGSERISFQSLFLNIGISREIR